MYRFLCLLILLPLLLGGTPDGPECTDCNTCDEVSFLAIGDTRSGHDTHRTLIAQMLEQTGPEFYLHSGDLVSRGNSTSRWNTFMEIEAPLMEQIPIVPSVGNHDGSRNQSWGFADRFGLENTYHSMGQGNVLVISVDGHVEVDSNGRFNADQMAWLQEALGQASNYRWVIIQTHVGPYGASQGRSGSSQIRELLDEFEAAGVDLILSGHDHLYEHGLTENGIDYIVSAGGGAGLYQPRDGDRNHTVLETSAEHHFLRFDASCESLRVRVINIEGEMIDEFTIQ